MFSIFLREPNLKTFCLRAFLFAHFIFRPKFRSYKPQDDSLKEKALEDAKPADVEAEVEEQLKAATTKAVIEELVRILLDYYLFF